MITSESSLCKSFCLVLDFHVKGLWKKWPQNTKAPLLLDTTLAFQLIIPTVDTAKYYYLMNLFVENSNPFLLLGPPGTGKSVYIKDLLTRKLDNDKFASVTLFFTSNTSPTTTQNIIMSKLDKRRKGT